MSNVLDSLEAIYQEVKENTPEYLEATGDFTGEIASAKFDANNKWSDGTIVPQVVLGIKVTEGEHEGKLAYLNLNLNGRKPENRNIALSVFFSTLRKAGIDTEELTLTQSVEKAVEEFPGKAVEFEMVKSGDFVNPKIKKFC